MTVESSDSHILRVPELGMDTMYGHGDPLRVNSDVNVYDMIAAGERVGLNIPDTLKILARQLYIYKQKGLYDDFDGRRDWQEVFDIFRRKKKLPFLVAHTTSNILQFGINESIDPTVFERNRYRYTPPANALWENGYRYKDVVEVINGPALVAGSVALIHWDGIDENKVLLKERESGAYKGLLSLPGGHGEGPLDPVSLAELIEETGLDQSFLRSTRTVPLGSADQLIFARGSGTDPRLKRYLNLMWTVDVSFNPHVEKAREMGWRMYDDDEITKDMLTPIAQIALKAAKFL